MKKRSRLICVNGSPNEASFQQVEPGDTVLDRISGTFAHFDGPNDLSVTLPVITAVSIADLAEVADHQITRTADTVAHHVRFHGGGEVHIVYSLSGEVLELCGERLITSTSASGLVSVGAYRPPSDAPRA
jgi:hypothetical protein